MNIDELRRRLDRLARRGKPRGAGTVLAAARREAHPPSTGSRPVWTPLAVAASVTLLVVSVAAIGLVSDGDDSRDSDSVAGGADVSLPMQFIAETRLQQFGDCDDLLAFAKEKAAAVVGPYGLPHVGGGVIEDAVAVAEGNSSGGESSVRDPARRSVGDAAVSGGPASGRGEAAAAPTAPQAAGDVQEKSGDADAYSTTNVQEQGVDEADTVKTDGKTIFSLARGRLWAVSVADDKVLGSVALNAQSFFLAGDRIIGVGQSMGFAGNPEMRDSRIAIGGSRTPVTIVDIAKPDAMNVLSSVEIDGQYLSARVVGGVARIVTSSAPRLEFEPQALPEDYGDDWNDKAKAANADTVKNSKVEDWLPRMTVRDAGGRAVVTDKPVGCDAAYHPPEVSGFGFLNVLTLNPAKPEDSHTASVMADGDTVYSSGTRLYVATRSWGPLRALGELAASRAVVPVDETLIHQFDISDPTQAAYRKSGKVRGHVLNQFSMSEHEGHLRVATTDDNNGRAGESESFVTVLGDNPDGLVQVGQVGGLGKGEQIYAVRFLGAVGYVVTFRQTDPLYTIDLSDPTKPRTAGELKITGYSAYLHPVGKDRLIGVGQEASEDGRRQGTQVSLFDVSDAGSPKRLAQYHLPGGNSPAEFDHHAFLYWDPKKLTVIPYQQYDGRGIPAAGAIALRTTEEKVEEIGKITHDDPRGREINSPIQRSLVIGERLYTVSEKGLLASDIDSLDAKAFVNFS